MNKYFLRMRILIIAFSIAMMFSQLSHARYADIPPMTNPEINRRYDLSKIYRIGIMRPELGTDVDTAIPSLHDEVSHVFAQFREALKKEKAYISKIVEDEPFLNMTPQRVIEIGKDNEIDALMLVTLRSFKRKYDYIFSNGKCIKALVSIGIQVYETETGTLVIDYIQDRKGANCNMAEQAANVAHDTSYILKNLGITGRSDDRHSPSIYSKKLDREFRTELKTSVPTITVVAHDDMELSEYSCYVNGKSVFSAELSGREEEITCYFSGAEDEGTIEVIDWAGNYDSQDVEIVDTGEVVEGKIVKIIDDDIYLNIGENAGVEEGMAFTIIGFIEITDPDSGEVLDEIEKYYGILVVEKVNEKISIAIFRFPESKVTIDDIEEGFEVF